jgi:hypothetical protein
MIEESEHYTGTSKVHKSPTNLLDPELATKYKHIRRPDLPRAILEVYSIIVEHVARILLASGPRWWPCGEQLHRVAHSRTHFVLDYGMHTQACSSV